MKNIFECTGHKLKIPNIVDSKGVFLFDADGKRYMDLESGVWCTSLGNGGGSYILTMDAGFKAYQAVARNWEEQG